ncbi:uncharacterized protein [Onthophagus taurus]|uniref:uncharacterized protein n=1 Tax=Onthophagus taurus TaxID=166361 RepID=UPI0039BE8792
MNINVINSRSYEKWLRFFELYKSLVHDNARLNKIQKFYYLQSCLKDDALRIINSLEISEANYDVAIELLRERYENKKVLIRNHVKNIFELQSLTRESHVNLRKLIDNFLKDFRSLQTLGEPVQHWDTLLIHIVSIKLDKQTQREWETHSKNITTPKLDQFLKVLKEKCQLLESLDGKLANKFNERTNEKVSMHITSNNEKTAFMSCTFCKNNDHFTFKCEKLLKLPINERYNELKKNNICTNCLKSGHTPNKCNSKSCQICQKRHNTILHDKNFHLRQRQATNIKAHVSRSEISKIDHDTKQSRWSDDEQENDEKPPITMTSQSNIPKTRQIILPTAIINVYNKHGEFVKCRALLDSGSQSNFCTKFLFDKLQLTGKDIAAPVSGISQSICNITCKTETIIKSADCSYQNKLEFLVINNITGSLPQASFDTSNLRIPSDLKLADPSYNETTEIDVLLGCEIFYDLMKPDQLKLGKHGPILQNTKLGWIVAGPMLGKIKQKNETRCFLATDNLHKQIERFWEIENIEIANSKLSKEKMECELNFREEFERDETGQFTVKLPLRDNHISLGDSFDIAKNRLISLERKLAKNSNLRQEYNNFLKEYEDLGHMTLTSFDKCDNDIVNYLPHHAVIKQTSSTTKVRVVFDASAKTTSGLSLNDVLKVGTKIQSDLFDIVVRMRMHPIVITADAEKMYRMILIHKTQRDFQRILWRLGIIRVVMMK